MWEGQGGAYGSELCLRCSGVEEMLARLSALGLFLRWGSSRYVQARRWKEHKTHLSWPGSFTHLDFLLRQVSHGRSARERVACEE